MKKKKTLEREKNILEFCSNEKKHITEIIKEFNMNVHTLRSKYIYPLIKDGKLKRLGARWYVSSK